MYNQSKVLFAVFEKEACMNSINNQVVFGPYKTIEEAKEAKVEWCNTDNYYINELSVDHISPKTSSMNDNVVCLIRYDDQDKKDEIITSFSMAEKRYEQISSSWNAQFFVMLKANSRDEIYKDYCYKT